MALRSPRQTLGMASTYILLSLINQDRHGYDIMKQTAIASEGAVRLGPGTLYEALRSLTNQQLIDAGGTTASGRRRYYRITEKGRRLLNMELDRFQAILAAAGRTALISVTLTLGLLVANAPVRATTRPADEPRNLLEDNNYAGSPAAAGVFQELMHGR